MELSVGIGFLLTISYPRPRPVYCTTITVDSAALGKIGVHARGLILCSNHQCYISKIDLALNINPKRIVAKVDLQFSDNLVP